MALVQKLISSSKYDIKCPYAMDPIGICIHNTANDAPAKNEVSYMHSNNNEVSFHVAVDDKESIQALPFNRNAWAAGDGGKGTGNRYYIHFEICYSKSGGARFIEAEKRAAVEIATLLKSRGWGIDRVKKHQDFSGKYCPHRSLDMGYPRLIEMIKANLGNTTSSAPVPNHGTSIPAGAMYRAVAGSYSVRANAEAQQAKLKAEGYDAFLLAVTAADGKTYLRVVAGSFKEKATAEKRVQELINKGYNAFVAVYDSNDNAVSSGSGSSSAATSNPALGVGNKVNITATHYSTGQLIPAEQKGNKVHTIRQISGDKALLAEIFSWVPLSGLKLAGSGSSSNSSSIPSSGKCTITTPSGIRFRNKPSVNNGTVQGTYSCGESVNYDSVTVAEGYTWISWVSSSKGVRRYMPIINHSSGEVWGKCV